MTTGKDFYLLDAAAQETRLRELALAALPLWGLQARDLKLIKYRENAVDMAFAALVAGYREHRELPAEQLACMPLFFAARSFTYLGWIHTRKETETARTLGPKLIAMACKAAQAYLQDPSAQD
jgi:Ser/Thr protein kinase RdoA (MazF antagonist)